jgi:hypothetical protein
MKLSTVEPDPKRSDKELHTYVCGGCGLREIIEMSLWSDCLDAGFTVPAAAFPGSSTGGLLVPSPQRTIRVARVIELRDRP